MRKYLVLGLGISGRASAAFLLSKGFNVIGADRNATQLSSDPQIISLLSQGMELISDQIPLPPIDQLILSPGIPSSHPLVMAANSSHIEVIGEVEFALRHIRNRCIAITGSNGKTTTVLLLTHLLNRAGKKARALGNIGASVSDYLLQADPNEILVIELSSFQLESLKMPIFEAAAILNITPNHLNWHPNMESYAKAKARILGCLKIDAPLFLSKQVVDSYGYLFNQYTLVNHEMIAQKCDLRYIKRGLPERESIAMALAFCKHCGVEVKDEDLNSFQKPPHRIEWVAEKEGIHYFNDSKASNVEAVNHAMSLFEGPLVLIAGGVHKGSSYSPWTQFQGKVKSIVAFGEASNEMERELSPHFPFCRCQNLEEALFEAKKRAVQGDTILLSPGCSSYDQFKSFEHRGDEFKRMVRGLK